MTLEVFIDYACPFCYAGVHHLLEIIGEYQKIDILWRPVEAHPAPEEPMVIGEASETWWSTRLQEHLDLPFVVQVPPSPVPRSVHALAGLLYLQEQGINPISYTLAVYQAGFRDKKKIDDIALLQNCARESGVDSEAFASAIESEEYHQKIIAANQYAYETNQIEFIPTYIMNGRRLDAVASRGVTKVALAEFLKAATEN